MERNLITCDNVTFAYEGNPVAVNLSFTVKEGDYLCIVGQNGSGKTTLLKGLLGLKAPLKGKVRINADLRPTQIGYLPQQTAAQKDFPASVDEVVLSGCIGRQGFRPFFGAAEKLRALENMRLLGIESYRKRCYRELSGGEQQRVLLARALCATEKLLLLDEPAAGLDPFMSKEMYQIISDLHQRQGITIIMITHDIQNVIPYCTHVLHLNGTLLFCGEKQEYVQTPLGHSFLERPDSHES